MSDFKQFWNSYNSQDAYSFEKAEKLSKSEIEFVRSVIGEKQRKGWISSKIIKYLQKTVPKLNEEWKASRAYWTETKHEDTQLIAQAGDDLEIEDYKVILSPDACELCRKKTHNGGKIFKSSEVQKAGFGHVPPFHPSCYCILIPIYTKQKK